jgi:hypothetical protein
MELINASGPEKMKQFLYGELSEEESHAIEERLFVDGEFFYELKGLENDLVDKYVQGKLSGEDFKRFEKSLTKSEARIAQVKNARALQRYIAEQKNAASPVADTETPRQRIPTRLLGFISFQSPAMQYAMVGLILLMGIAAAWLLYDSSRARDEQSQRVRELQNEIEASRQQIAALQQKLDEQSGRNEELSKELHDREAKLRQLERELERRGSQNESPAIVAATITAVESRGGAEPPKVIRRSARFVTVQLPLLIEADYEDYEIRDIDQKEIAAVKEAISRSGKKYLVVTLPARTAVFTVIGVNNETGEKKKIDEYRLEVHR